MRGDDGYLHLARPSAVLDLVVTEGDERARDLVVESAQVLVERSCDRKDTTRLIDREESALGLPRYVAEDPRTVLVPAAANLTVTL